jgi:hypothetical protein
MHEMGQDDAPGDKPLKTKSGHGIDVAVQPEDFLDGSAIRHVRSVFAEPGTARALDAACASGGQARRMARAGAAIRQPQVHCLPSLKVSRLSAGQRLTCDLYYAVAAHFNPGNRLKHGFANASNCR